MGMDGWAFLEHGADLARRGESFALATVVWRQGPSSGKESCRAIVTADGALHGWIGGACAEPVVIRQAKEVIAEGVPRLLLLGTPDQFSESLPDGMMFVPISCSSEGSLEVYIEPVQPSPHLVVVGHSPMAQTLAELARALGWRTDLIAGLDFTAEQAGPRSIVVVATPPTSGWSGRPGGAGPCSATWPNGGCPRPSWTGCTARPGWTWAGPRTRRSPWPSWPSWCS